MMLNFLRNKSDIIKTHQMHPNDRGSVFVRVALLTAKIAYLSNHVNTNMKDRSAKMSLVRMVQERKKFLSYIKKNYPEKHPDFVRALGLRLKES